MQMVSLVDGNMRAHGYLVTFIETITQREYYVIYRITPQEDAISRPNTNI